MVVVAVVPSRNSFPNENLVIVVVDFKPFRWRWQERKAVFTSVGRSHGVVGVLVIVVAVFAIRAAADLVFP